ncbi:LysR family glycine cleavage system transcriptional activator [Robbsia andropogonis]|uniref:LysR substrate-binding domain-containing protein n=1 Tax=Robbsia andropogonis TaxID=28092 RepID=UPI003D224286
MPSSPSLTSLKVFEVVTRHGSIRQAALELDLTPQAVSHRIKTLEETLGRALFERRVSSVTPTPAARLLQEHVSAAMKCIDDGLAALTRMDSTQKLSIQVSPFFASHYLMPDLSAFTQRYPDLDLRISIAVEMPDMKRAELDGVVLWGYGGAGDMFFETTLVDDLKVITYSADLAEKKPIHTPTDLLDHTLISPLADTSLWRHVLSLMQLQDAPARHLLQIHTHSAMLDATVSGLGVGLLSYPDAIALIQQGRLLAPFGLDYLKRLPATEMPRFTLVQLQDAPPSEIMQAFVAWLREIVQRDAARDHAVTKTP